MSSTNTSSPGAETMGHKATMAIKGAVESVKSAFTPAPPTIGERVDSTVNDASAKMDSARASTAKGKLTGS